MSVRKGQARLKKIAGQISKDKQLSPEDREFLVKALSEISNGEDAETWWGVKAKKGERKSKHVKDTKFNLELAYGWLATATAPENVGGLGLTLRNAVARLTAEWGQLPSEETLLRYWNNVKNNQERDFEIKTD